MGGQKLNKKNKKLGPKKGLHTKNSDVNLEINKIIDIQNRKKEKQNKTSEIITPSMMTKLVSSKSQPRAKTQTLPTSHSGVNRLVENLGGADSLTNTKNLRPIKKSTSDPALNKFIMDKIPTYEVSTVSGGTQRDISFVTNPNSADLKNRPNSKLLEIQIDVKSPRINKELRALTNVTDLKPIIKVSEFTVKGPLTQARNEILTIIGDKISQFELPITGQFKFVKSNSLLEMPIQSEVLTNLVDQTLHHVSEDLKVTHTGKGAVLVVNIQDSDPPKTLMEQVELGTEFVDELSALCHNSEGVRPYSMERTTIQLRECEFEEHSLTNFVDEEAIRDSEEDIEIIGDNNEFIRSAISHLIDEDQNPRRYYFVLKLELRGKLDELLSKIKAELICEDETQTKFIVQENYLQALFDTAPTFDPPKSSLFRKVSLALKNIQIDAGQLRLMRNLGTMSLELDSPTVSDKIKEVLNGFPTTSLLRISIPIVTNRNTETSSLLAFDYKEFYQLFKRNGRTDIFSLINSLSTVYEILRDAFTFGPITFTCPSLIPFLPKFK